MAKQASKKETDSKKTSASKVKEKVKEKAAEVKETVKKKTAAARGKAKEKAAEVKEKVNSTVRQQTFQRFFRLQFFLIEQKYQKLKKKGSKSVPVK